MKKSKLFKTISFSSLALLMGIAGAMAFAPLGASPNNLANASEMVDQINTKADGENIKYAPSALGLDPENDPVIYTTESGLEIKYGGVDLNNSLASGKPLSGYPYFTMGTYSGYAVNWVIIGRNTNDTVFTSAISSHLYSTWKTNNNVSYSGLKPFAKYWFNGGGYETTTPAGSAINGVVPSKSYVADVTKATKTVVGNAEVPSGCVLAISECCLGQAQFNSSASSTTSNTNWTGNRYRYEADQYSGDATYNHTYNNKLPGDLYTYMSNLYSTNLNFSSSEKQLIQAQKLTTRYYTTSSKIDTYDTDGNTLYSLFPLATTISGVSQNFCLETYLSTAALKKAYLINDSSATCSWWLRTGGGSNYSHRGFAILTDGSLHAGGATGNPYAARPACVIKLG